MFQLISSSRSLCIILFQGDRKGKKQLTFLICNQSAVRLKAAVVKDDLSTLLHARHRNLRDGEDSTRSSNVKNITLAFIVSCCMYASY